MINSKQNTKSARRAGTWLQARLRELREQASTAERAVVAFKNKNEMVDTGGRTINEQQLAELNSELVLARSRTAEAQRETRSRAGGAPEQLARGHRCWDSRRYPQERGDHKAALAIS